MRKMDLTTGADVSSSTSPIPPSDSPETTVSDDSEASAKPRASAAATASVVEQFIGALTHLVARSCDQVGSGLGNRSRRLNLLLQDQLAWINGVGQPTFPTVGHDDYAQVTTKETSHIFFACFSFFFLHFVFRQQVGSKVDYWLVTVAGEQQQSPFGWTELVEHIRFRLQTLLAEYSPSTTVTLHGAAITGLTDATTEIDLSFNSKEFGDMESTVRTKRNDVLRRIKTVESALAGVLQLDKALDNIRACMKDIRQALLSNSDAVRAQRFSAGADDDLAVIDARKAAKANADGEMMCKFGDRLVEVRQAEALRSRQQVQVKALLEQLTLLRKESQELQMTIDLSRTQSLERLAPLLRDLGYSSIQVGINNRTGIIRFVDEDAPAGPMSCRLSVGDALCEHSSRLVGAYIRLDKGGKLNTLMAFVKSFAKKHGLVTQLSVYGWSVLVIHWLLRFGYIDNIQRLAAADGSNEAPKGTEDGAGVTAVSDDQASSPAPTSSLSDRETKESDNTGPVVVCSGFNVAFDEAAELSPSCVAKLESTSLFEMLVQFFSYYVCDVDVFGHVLTLRGAGEVTSLAFCCPTQLTLVVQVMSKAAWGDGKEGALWRLCVEVSEDQGIGCLSCPLPS